MKHRPAPASQLRQLVEKVVADYLDDLDDKQSNGSCTCQLHKKIIDEVEPALFNAVLEHTDNNQTRAAEVLGMTRSTLRARIKRYGLLD